MSSLRCSTVLGCFLLAAAPAVVLAADAPAAPAAIFARPVPPLQTIGETKKPDPLEKQFRTDTGENASTRRAQAEVHGRVRSGANVSFVAQPDIGGWPAEVRDRARMWVAVGAPSAITTEGTLGVRFNQNGTGLETAVDNTFNVDGTIVFGCDYSLRDGAVMLDLIPGERPHDVEYTIRAIIYVPQRDDPANRARKS